jgi:2-keto-3-deoxy-L-rhamnonate aldolase RhmA
VDCVLVGPNDLSISLGVAGQYDHPLMQASIQKVLAACAAHKVIPALHINDMKLMAHWASKGMKLLSSASDVELLVRGATACVAELRQCRGTK